MRNSVVLNILLFTVAVLLFCCQKSPPPGHFRIKQGKFQSSIIETGELQAVNSRAINMPFVGWQYGWRYKITGLLDHGSPVSKDDSIAQIDESSVMKFIIEKENQLKLQQTGHDELKIHILNKKQELESNIRSSKANYDLLQLQLSKYQFEPDKRRLLKDLEFKKSAIKYELAQKKYELAKITFAQDIKIEQIRIEKLEKQLREAHEALEKLVIRSPINGILQLRQRRRSREMIKIGEDLHQGSNIASVPDLSQMKVMSSINEVDIAKVHTGQEVTVRLDAFPDHAYYGKISDISKFCYEKEKDSNIKIFDIEVLLDKTHPSLKPGMTVSCEIKTAEYENVFYIENECVIKEKGESCLYTVKNNKLEKIHTEPLAVNNRYTALKGTFDKESEFLTLEEVKKHILTDKN